MVMIAAAIVNCWRRRSRRRNSCFWFNFCHSCSFSSRLLGVVVLLDVGIIGNLLVMGLYVNIQTCSLGKTIFTKCALIWLLSRVEPFMILSCPLGGETLSTPLTNLRFLPCVSPFVFHQLRFVIRVVITKLALKLTYFRFVSTGLVVSQFGVVPKTFTTLVTHSLFISSRMFQLKVSSQLSFIIEPLAANITDVIFLFGMIDGNVIDFICVSSQPPKQIHLIIN